MKFNESVNNKTESLNDLSIFAERLGYQKVSYKELALSPEEYRKIAMAKSAVENPEDPDASGLTKIDSPNTLYFKNTIPEGDVKVVAVKIREGIYAADFLSPLKHGSGFNHDFTTHEMEEMFKGAVGKRFE